MGGMGRGVLGGEGGKHLLSFEPERDAQKKNTTAPSVQSKKKKKNYTEPNKWNVQCLKKQLIIKSINLPCINFFFLNSDDRRQRAGRESNGRDDAL